MVCNPDLPVAYRELLDDVEAPKKARTGKYSPSCLLWVAGVNGLPPADASHHNIHFGQDWDGSFKALIEDGVRMPDPSILVTLHSLDDPSLAPEGSSSIYVLEPTPNLSGTIDWSRERDRIMGSLRNKVASLGYPTDVVVEEIYDPQDWERMGMEQGTPFALAHTFFQTGPFRPNNVDKRVPGPRVHRIVDAARRRRPDGPRLGQARRATRRRVRRPLTRPVPLLPCRARCDERRESRSPHVSSQPVAGELRRDVRATVGRTSHRNGGTAVRWNRCVSPT